MEDASYWITPLALLPGVALLVMSTAMRFGQLHDELHRREGGAGHAHGNAEHLFRRARMLRNALVSLYASAALLAISGLLGGMATLTHAAAMVPVLGLSALAVGCLAFAAVTLIRESLLLMNVIEEHRHALAHRPAPND
ncbi:MAG: DUF2721 domain-containing protein [Myxococcota bacterium]